MQHQQSHPNHHQQHQRTVILPNAVITKIRVGPDLIDAGRFNFVKQIEQVFSEKAKIERELRACQSRIRKFDSDALTFKEQAKQLVKTNRVDEAKSVFIQAFAAKQNSTMLRSSLRSLHERLQAMLLTKELKFIRQVQDRFNNSIFTQQMQDMDTIADGAMEDTDNQTQLTIMQQQMADTINQSANTATEKVEAAFKQFMNECSDEVSMQAAITPITDPRRLVTTHHKFVDDQEEEQQPPPPPAGGGNRRGGGGAAAAIAT